MELCDRLIELRKNAHLSQEQLAELLNISRQAVSKWESGASSPDVHNIIQLGKLYNVSTDYILLGKAQEVEPPVDLEPGAEKQGHKCAFLSARMLWAGLLVLAVLVLYFATNVR